MIYENDIPESYQAWIQRKEPQDQLEWRGAYKRMKSDKLDIWKPNGITNNIEEWEKKHNQLLWESSAYRLYNAVRRN